MIGIIGEVKKFIISKETVKFLSYTNTYEEMLTKLQKMNLKLIDNENNRLVKEKVINNISTLPKGYKEKVVGAVAVYYDTVDGSVKLGEIDDIKLSMALTVKNLKYCFKDINSEIRLSKETPMDMLLYKERNSDTVDVKTLDTELYLEVISNKDKVLQVPITARYNIYEDNNSDSEYPIMFSNLEEIHKLQYKRKQVKSIENKLDISIEEFRDVAITEDDLIRYKTKDIRKAKVLKIYERRFK